MDEQTPTNNSDGRDYDCAIDAERWDEDDNKIGSECDVWNGRERKIFSLIIESPCLALYDAWFFHMPKHKHTQNVIIDCLTSVGHVRNY